MREIGEVTESGELRVLLRRRGGRRDPGRLLTEEAPRYRVEPRPRRSRRRSSTRPIAGRAGPSLLELLASPNVRSRRAVWERYDHLVGSRTVRRPGLDAAVLRLRPRSAASPSRSTAPGRAAPLDPRTGGTLAVLEAARNVACAGGRPLAVTDCLNFGNPEKAGVAWELTEAIEGMALACEALGVPVVSGNVSLYNETDGRAIHPTPVVGCVGLVEDVHAVPGRWEEGDASCSPASPSSRSTAPSTRRASSAARPAGRRARTSAPRRRSSRSSGARRRSLTAAHDASEGGLAVALAELALWSGSAREVELGDDAVDWFGEGGGQAVVACRPEDGRGARGHAVPLPADRHRRRRRVLGVELARPGRCRRMAGRRGLMCGIFGIHAPERDVARLAYFGLFALQHRGQESAGIAVSDEGA